MDDALPDDEEAEEDEVGAEELVALLLLLLLLDDHAVVAVSRGKLCTLCRHRNLIERRRACIVIGNCAECRVVIPCKKMTGRQTYCWRTTYRRG